MFHSVEKQRGLGIPILVGLSISLLVLLSPPLAANASQVGSWNSTTNYPISPYYQSCATSSGYIYCVGGYDGAYTNAVYYAPITSSGVGTWTATTSYPTVLAYSTCAIASGYIYCVAGWDGGYTDAVYYAPVSSSGVGAWTATTDFPTFTYSNVCATSSGYIYCVGGYDGAYSNQVYYAPVSSSGVGTWTATTSYPTGIGYQSCAVSSGDIICVAGWDGTYTNEVYYAPLSSSGVGAWNAGPVYPFSPYSEYCATSSGYIYCVGGYDSVSGYTDLTYYATFSSSSGVGTWTQGPDYPITITYQSCVGTSSDIYCIAGYGDSGYANSVYYAAVGGLAGPSSLPAVMPQHLVFRFQGATSITGNLVSVYGEGGLYNVRGYNAQTDAFPTAISLCYIASNNTVSISGFASLTPGSNATEFLVTDWISITQSAQGWPTEPACAA